MLSSMEMAASVIKENLFQSQEDLFIMWLYRIQSAKKLTCHPSTMCKE